MFGYPGNETHEAVFVRRDAKGVCRAVIARNTLPALRAQDRRLSYKTCGTLVATKPERLWELGGNCGAEKITETCPSLSAGFPCMSVPGDALAADCGSMVDEDRSRHQHINASDVLTDADHVQLEPGYATEWERLQKWADSGDQP